MSGLPPDNRGGTHVRFASSAHLKYFVDTSSRQPRRPLVGIVQLARTAGLGPADGGSSPSSDTAVCSASASRTHRVSRLKARNVDPFDHEGINKRTKRFAVTAGAVLRFQPSTCRVQSFVAAPSPPRVLAPVAKLERQRTFNPRIVGSNPTGGTSSSSAREDEGTRLQHARLSPTAVRIRPATLAFAPFTSSLFSLGSKRLWAAS